MKTCNTCLEPKEIICFSKNKLNKDGYHNRCKVCTNTYNRERDAKQRDKAREKTNSWRRIKKETNPEYFLFTRARHRAIKNNIPFDLDITDIVIPEFCPILGIKLNTQTKRGFINDAASVDRIIPELGYVKGNIEVISLRANRIKNNATKEELKLISDYYNS